MVEFLMKLLLVARSRLKSRARLEAENLVLRQQVIVLSRKSPSRVRLRNIDRRIFVWMFRLLPAILNAITVVRPEALFGGTEAAFGPIGAGNPACGFSILDQIGFISGADSLRSRGDAGERFCLFCGSNSLLRRKNSLFLQNNSLFG